MNLLLSDPAFLSSIAVAETPPAGFLLDTYTNAFAAFSLRQLRTGVTSIVRARRSSDNAEQDFTATEIIDGTLTAFCGGGDGFVRTWYDQTGNANHANNATTAQQFKIVSAGSLILSGGKPAIDTTGNTFISCPPLGNLSRQDYFSVKQTLSDTLFISPGGGASRYGWLAQSGSTNTGMYFGFGSPTLYINGQLQAVANRGGIYNAFNGRKLEATLNAETLWSSNFDIAYLGSGSALNSDYLIQEYVAFNSDQSVTRAGIEANINAYYNLY